LASSKEPQSDQSSTGDAKRQPALSLFVPPQSPPAPDSFLLDPKRTEAWFASLPKANVGETARRVYSTLVDFNRMEISPLLRARNAEQFRELVEYICNNLRRHFVDSGFPLREKGHKAAALARAMFQELAICYKSIIQDQLTGSDERFDRKLLVIALHRAASYLIQALRYTSLVYATWPPGLWRELNAIYAFAWQNRVNRIMVREGRSRNSTQTTLEDIYIGALMFATASPHRLRQGQQLALIEALPAWVRHARLGMPDEGELRNGQFQVDLFSDGPPPQRSAPDAPAASRRLRRLDLQPVLKELHQLFDATPWQGSAGSDTRGNALSRQLLRTVIQSWSCSQERRFVRTRLNFELQVVAGMNNLHNHLMQRHHVEEREADTSSRYASSFPTHQDTAPVDPWSEPYNTGLGDLLTVEADAYPDSVFTEGPMGSVLPDSLPPENQPDMPIGHSVRTLNESANGYCIRWQGDSLPRVRIGELLGIQGGGGEGEFSLAAIRWMCQPHNQALHFGVEILSPHCAAGEVSPTGESRKQYPPKPQRCLVIRAPNDQQNGCIILPSALFDVGALLQLRQGDQRNPIRLSKVVETTGAYARYQYEEENPSAGPTPSGKQELDEFQDLWTNL
jgi:hypothetical protein